MLEINLKSRFNRLFSSSPERSDQISQFGKVLACLLLAGIFLLPISPWIRPYAGNDSSVFLYIGNGILNGQVPYRDVWDHKPPLIYLINTLSLLLTPGSTWGIFFLQVAFLGAANLILWNLLSTRIQRIYLLFPLILLDLECLLLSQGGNLTSFYPIPFQLLAFAIFLRITQQSAPFKTGFGLGLCFLCTILIRPTAVGEFIALGLVVLLNNLLETPARWLKFVLGLLVSAICLITPFLLYFAFNHALADLWDQVYVFNRYYSASREFNDQINVIIEGLKLLSRQGLVPLAFLGILTVFRQTITRKKVSAWQQMVLLSFILDWILIAFAGRAKIPYYLTMLPVLTILTAVAIEYFQNRIRFRSLIVSGVFLALVFLGSTYRTEFQSSINQGQNSRRTKGAIVDYVAHNTKPTDKIVVWGTESWIYFHADRLAPVKLIYINPLYFVGYVSEDMLNGYYTSVVAAKPALIISTISDGKITLGFGDNSSEISRKLGTQLRETYQPVFNVDEWTIYKPLQP